MDRFGVSPEPDTGANERPWHLHRFWLLLVTLPFDLGSQIFCLWDSYCL